MGFNWVVGCMDGFLDDEGSEMDCYLNPKWRLEISFMLVAKSLTKWLRDPSKFVDPWFVCWFLAFNLKCLSYQKSLDSKWMFQINRAMKIALVISGHIRVWYDYYSWSELWPHSGNFHSWNNQHNTRWADRYKWSDFTIFTPINGQKYVGNWSYPL